MAHLSCVFIISIIIHGTFSRTIYFGPPKNDKDLQMIHKEKIDECIGKESINLSGEGLQKIPQHLVESDSIRSINLEDNLITHVSSDPFKAATNLECLNMARNQIPFDQLLAFGHNRLKTLIVGHQKHHYLEGNEPGEWDRYSSIVPHMDLKPIPEFLDTSAAKFPNLEHLDLSAVDFWFLPFNFSESFPRLTTLYLNDRMVQEIFANKTMVWPSSLRSLHVRNNRLASVDINYASNVEAMYFDGNPLTDFIHIRSATIRLLSFSNCDLRDIHPEMLSNVPNLRSLDLSQNSIANLPLHLFGATPLLESLSLSRNELREFPELNFLGSLRDLSLSYNHIEYVTYPIPFVSLKKLSLRGNGISVIGEDAFWGLENLEELDLAENGLQTLPYGWASRMVKLRHLNLQNNMFATLTDMSISYSEISDLFIRGNVVSSIDETELQAVPEKCVVYVT